MLTGDANALIQVSLRVLPPGLPALIPHMSTQPLFAFTASRLETPTRPALCIACDPIDVYDTLLHAQIPTLSLPQALSFGEGTRTCLRADTASR